MVHEQRTNAVRGVRRVVVKVGTDVISSDDGCLDYARIADLARQICMLRERGVEVVLVSSGAIGAGMGELKLSERPRRLPELQAVAAVGQGKLMAAWAECFAGHGYHAAQVLLTRQDVDDRTRYLNAANTLRTLLALDCVPVINENDTTSVEEITFGDNDVLSALVTHLTQADLLVILSIVPGLYADVARADSVLPVVAEINDEVMALAGAGRSRHGVGGMAAKLAAARMATEAGNPVVLAGGREADVLPRLLDGEALGTLFLPAASRLRSRKRWIGYGSRPRGRITVNEGARAAIVEGGKSLLAAGIVAIGGTFPPGALVAIVDAGGVEFARGLVNYSSAQLEQIKGLRSDAIERVLGSRPFDEAVHRDNLTLRER